MLFNTLTYLAFLTLVFALYWLLPLAARRWVFLLASLAFYGFWRVDFLALITFSAFVDYFFSLKIHDEQISTRRRLWLVCSLATNLALLVYFKYAYFLTDNLTGLASGFGYEWHFPLGEIILPLGISFYTFLSISYTVDVYRREFTPLRNFTQYLTYVTYWPHMIAGPILRAHELIPQLFQRHGLKQEHLVVGLRYILTGLFLKVGVADQLAPMVDDAFAMRPTQLGGLDVWTMSYAFGLQIYLDFAGYSMIAIGSAMLFAVRFPENFNWPYLATSPREFWKRWHITLSAWIRDYLYVPLTGAVFKSSSHGGLDIQSEKSTSWRLVLALFLTWFIMGLWHGAGWNFALWGVWHACLVAGYRLFKRKSDASNTLRAAIVGWLVTQPLIMLGWLPFRAGSLHDTLALLERLVDWRSYAAMGLRENFYLITFLVYVGMLVLWLVYQRKPKSRLGGYVSSAADTVGLAAMIVVVFVFLRPINQFIYFQF